MFIDYSCKFLFLTRNGQNKNAWLQIAEFNEMFICFKRSKKPNAGRYVVTKY